MRVSEYDMQARSERASQLLGEIRALFPGSNGVTLLIHNAVGPTDFLLTSEPLERTIAILQSMETRQPRMHGDTTVGVGKRRSDA